MNSLQKVSRKITAILFAQQSLASAGFMAAATRNSIVGAKLAGNASWAGVPSAVYLFGGALAAFAWGHIFDLIGRPNGLVSGLLLGTIGSGIAVYAISTASFGLFMAGLLLMGIANAAVQLGRFAAAEVNPPEQRVRAISNVVIGGTIGSVVGPFVADQPGNSSSQSPGTNWQCLHGRHGALRGGCRRGLSRFAARSTGTRS